jgi:predicted permease
VATLAGIAVSLTAVEVPKPLYEAIHLLGQVAIPLMLFSLGVRMTGIGLTDWRIGIAGALMAPLTGLLLAWLTAQGLEMQGRQAAQLLLFGALPPAVLNFMLAERYDVEPQRVAAIVLLGNFASILVIPAVLYLVL